MPTPRRHTAPALLASASLTLIGLAGCGLPSSATPAAVAPQPRPGELDQAHQRPCPREMPADDDPHDRGLGTSRAAEERPTLPVTQEAWVCQYDIRDAAPTPGVDSVIGWRRSGRPEPVGASDLPHLDAALADLAPADPGRVCTADLGPRWMVVTNREGDLTAVVVDGYGCRAVRLSDDPHSTAPGSDDQDGTVSGVLDGGEAVLAALGLDRAR